MKTLREQIMEFDGYGTVQADGVMVSGNIEKMKQQMNSDGYHTFDELYRYRALYNAGFFNELHHAWDIVPAIETKSVVKSLRHSDGELCFGGGWFIVMANLPTGQISNHYEMKYWDLFKIPEVEKAPEWDGHTPEQASERLEAWLKTS